MAWDGWHGRTSPTGEHKYECRDRHANRCKDAHDRFPLFAEECSYSLSQHLVSWRSRLMVSRILLIWDRRAALFVEMASSLACRSSSMATSNSFARLFANSTLILVMAFLTPARSLVACVTHATSICGSSIVFNAASTSPVVPMTSLVAPERSLFD